MNANTGWRLYSPSEGRVGQLEQTSDGGQTWTTIKSVTWQSAQFDFVSEQVGWSIVTASDSKTALLHTRDGGKTWEEISPVIAP